MSTTRTDFDTPKRNSVSEFDRTPTTPPPSNGSVWDPTYEEASKQQEQSNGGKTKKTRIATTECQTKERQSGYHYIGKNAKAIFEDHIYMFAKVNQDQESMMEGYLKKFKNQVLQFLAEEISEPSCCTKRKFAIPLSQLFRADKSMSKWILKPSIIREFASILEKEFEINSMFLSFLRDNEDDEEEMITVDNGPIIYIVINNYLTLMNLHPAEKDLPANYQDILKGLRESAQTSLNCSRNLLIPTFDCLFQKFKNDPKETKFTISLEELSLDAQTFKIATGSINNFKFFCDNLFRRHSLDQNIFNVASTSFDNFTPNAKHYVNIVVDRDLLNKIEIPKE